MTHSPNIESFFSSPSTPFLSSASILFHFHDKENVEGCNLEVAQEKIVIAPMVRKFVVVRQKVVTLGYLGLDLQQIMFVGQPQDFTFKEFEVHILGKMKKDSHRALEAWISIEILIYDVDTHEMYPLNLSKKQSFWSKQNPFIDQSLRKERSFYPNATMMQQPLVMIWKMQERVSLFDESFSFSFSFHHKCTIWHLLPNCTFVISPHNFVVLIELIQRIILSSKQESFFA